MKHTEHRFKVGDQIFFEEEVLTVSQLTDVNGWPHYYVMEYGWIIPDNWVSVPPVPVCETPNF